jgi:hypothetical protein
VSGVAATEEGEAVTDALNRLYDDVCRDFYAVLADDSMETRQTFFDQLAANIREVKAEQAAPAGAHALIVRLMCDDGPQDNTLDALHDWIDAIPENERAALHAAMPDIDDRGRVMDGPF